MFTTQRLHDATSHLRIAIKAESMGITHAAERHRMKAERLLFEQRLEDLELFATANTMG